MIRKNIIRGRIQATGDRWRKGDNTTKAGSATQWAYHVGMAHLIFDAYWDGSRNTQKTAARYALQFIRDHQGIKNRRVK